MSGFLLLVLFWIDAKSSPESVTSSMNNNNNNNNNNNLPLQK